MFLRMPIIYTGVVFKSYDLSRIHSIRVSHSNYQGEIFRLGSYGAAERYGRLDVNYSVNERAWVIAGHIKDRDGNPVAGATVSASAWWGFLTTRPSTH